LAFWSGDKLNDEGRRNGIVEPFDSEQLDDRIDCSALVLTLGEECFVTPHFGDTNPSRKQKLELGRLETAGGKTKRLNGGEMIIPAGQFAFLLTEEFIKIPANTMGFISLKSKVKWKGLINVSGFHVDPGFHGRLVYSVYNAGPSNIHLARGMPLFLLWITDLDKESKIYQKNSPPQREIPSELVSEVDRPLHSLQSLSEKIETLQRELTLLYRVLAALGVIGALILAAWALLPGSNEQERRAVAADVL
jgi:dCTP deaminase